MWIHPKLSQNNGTLHRYYNQHGKYVWIEKAKEIVCIEEKIIFELYGQNLIPIPLYCITRHIARKKPERNNYLYYKVAADKHWNCDLSIINIRFL